MGERSLARSAHESPSPIKGPPPKRAILISSFSDGRFLSFPSNGRKFQSHNRQLQGQSVVGPGEYFGDKCKVDEIALMDTEKAQVGQSFS